LGSGTNQLLAFFPETGFQVFPIVAGFSVIILIGKHSLVMAPIEVDRKI
jgi:ABC-type sulfate transport system permease subunit